MKIKDAEQAIKMIWLNWESNKKFENHFGMHLYNWLNKNRPELLGFRARGDKYQRIAAWVRSWQQIFKE